MIVDLQLTESGTSERLAARVHRVPRGPARPEFRERLSRRRGRLADDLAAGRAGTRYFPLLSVLAPVMTQAEGEITYPGDPMCLYAALSVAVHRAVRDAGPIAGAKHYNDFAPEWTHRPSRDYRLAVDDDGYRPYGTQPNTDQTVFDPRVWDEKARTRWIRLLREVRPRVVLISAVSPAHRYALEIAGLVKVEVPDSFVVLGGRHVDETIRLDPDGTVRGDPSSPVAVIAEGKVPRVIDALVSGEAYHSLDLLLRALALAVDLDTGWVRRAQVADCLAGLLREEGEAPGRSLIALLDRSEVHAYPQEGPALDLESLPSPYAAFAIRSRFPIFDDPVTGETRRTAHIMVSNACPYHCNFCSESAKLANGLKKFRNVAVGVALVCEYVGYGAEALFFDDSVFWSGNYRDIEAFCTVLADLREGTDHDGLLGRLLPDEQDHARLRDLTWGAQFTVDGLVALHKTEESARILRLMRAAGCTYVYIGIESLSAQVMDGIHKNLRRTGNQSWDDKARRATALVKSCGLRVGTSVLFGLNGETRASIDETIEGVGRLIDDNLVDLASPNILTYHPATPITRLHGMRGKLDYHSPRVDNRKPYIYFEEAFPGVVSRVLDEDDLWHIHRETERRWGGARNDSAVPPADA
ncbi:B12-binding domain-containing radical SAM protein [Actinokineospora enzanensis]|uniref:B12-binding domain-containing radical SAM protein n=1 Tax=Actinokineospora enzanensis TaxID=155975 RepID=UPI0012EC632D|nr:B12-binding domain-containing radical SAM protein [Actinokineospora enzanensis]